MLNAPLPPTIERPLLLSSSGELESVVRESGLRSEPPTVSFNSRSGIVHTADSEVLFVNLGGSSKYGNIWGDDGKVLTFFLREHQWRGGTTPLGMRLLRSSAAAEQAGGGGGVDDGSVETLLYARRGKSGNFVWCGRCGVREATADDDGDGGPRNDGDLVTLELLLLDFEALSLQPQFVALLGKAKRPTQREARPGAAAGAAAGAVPQAVEEEEEGEEGQLPLQEEHLQRVLSRQVCSGDVAGALVAALDACGTAASKRSVAAGIGCLKNLLAGAECDSEADPAVAAAVAVLDDMAAELGIF